MVIVSIDLGKVRTGLAVCDKNEILASPLCVIKETDEETLAKKISEKAKESNAESFVIGLPKNMDGSLGESAERVQKFVEILKTHISLPIFFWDERRTTVTAHEYLNEVNVRGAKRKNIIDTVSASIILENYLRFRKNRSCVILVP
jgi:putative Holliday junction resolvase